MKELRPEVKAFLENARDCDNPTPADKARVRKALFQTMAVASAAAAVTQSATASAAAQGASASGAAAQGAGAAASIKAGAGAGMLMKLAGILMVSGLATTTAVVWSNNSMPLETARDPLNPQWASSQPFNDTPMSSLSNTIEKCDNSVVDSAEPEGKAAEEGRKAQKNPSLAREQSASSREDSHSKNAVPKTGAQSTLEEETQHLREAHKALQAGDPEQAIKLLDEQSRSYEKGELAEERAAARVLALCKTSRTLEAKAALERFLSQNPNSPLSDRVRGACKNETR